MQGNIIELYLGDPHNLFKHAGQLDATAFFKSL